MTALIQLRVEMADPKPVSVNKLYSSDGARRFLTSAGKKFKSAFRKQIAETLMLQPVPWKTVVAWVYEHGAWCRLEIELHLESLRNQSWKVGGCMTKPKKRKDGTRPKPQPRSPYQRVDGSNYVKLIEDAVKEGTGIDDSCYLETEVRKREDKDNPRVAITFSVYE